MSASFMYESSDFDSPEQTLTEWRRAHYAPKPRTRLARLFRFPAVETRR